MENNIIITVKDNEFCYHRLFDEIVKLINNGLNLPDELKIKKGYTGSDYAEGNISFRVSGINNDNGR